ncbi:MAG: ATP-grasp domain-containing protein [Bacteroidota bacterium]
MNFLIQTIEGEVRHDFSFVLLESIKYQNWRTESKDFHAFFSDEEYPVPITNCIPSGSVEFVQNYIKKYCGKVPLPKNVPEQLFSFACRKIFNSNEQNLPAETRTFVKSNDQIKKFTEIVDGNYILEPGNYQFSELIDIDSEWRCFVYQKKLVGLQNYAGDFTLFPDVKKISKMIDAYSVSPIAYTLDVGINSQATFVIEVHDFFSCGLYGFSDHTIYPFMLSQWFHEFVRK